MKIGDVVKVTGPAYSKYLNKFGKVTSIRGEFIGVDFDTARDIVYVFRDDLVRGIPVPQNTLQTPWKTPTE